MSKEERTNTNANERTNNRRRNDGLNIGYVMGRLTQDPEVTEYNKNGRTGKVCSNMSIAVNDYGMENTEFIKITLWDADAERYAKFLHKGDYVVAVGKKRTQEYTKDSVTRQQEEMYKVFEIKVLMSAKRNKAEKAESANADNQEDYPEIGDVGGDGLDDFVDPVDLGDEDLPF